MGPALLCTPAAAAATCKELRYEHTFIVGT